MVQGITWSLMTSLKEKPSNITYIVHFLVRYEMFRFTKTIYHNKKLNHNPFGFLEDQEQSPC